MPADWDILSSEGSPFQGELIRKVDLWRFQECRSIGLQELGEIFSSEVAAQDEAPVLIAYSMGARLALHALLARPDPGAPSLRSGMLKWYWAKLPVVCLIGTSYSLVRCLLRGLLMLGP